MPWKFNWLMDWEDVWAAPNMEQWFSAFAGLNNVQATPFMHPDFALAWLRTVGGQDAYLPFFLAAESTSGQRVLWLFVRPKAGLVRKMVPVGARVYPYRSGFSAYLEPIVIARPGRAPKLEADFWQGFRTDLARHAGSWFDVCAIPRFRTAFLGVPDDAAQYNVAPFLRLDDYDDIESYLSSRKPKVRSSIRRRLRRIAEAGEVVHCVHAPDDIDGVLAWLPKLEAERRRRHDFKGDTEVGLEHLLRIGGRSGLVHCSSLKLDGRSISWMFGYYLDGIYYGYFRAFDPDFASLSPGVVHFHHLLDWVLANRGRIIDFGIGAQDYKYEWTDGEEWDLKSLTIESRAPASLARLTTSRMARGLRDLKRRIPVEVGTDQDKEFADATVVRAK